MLIIKAIEDYPQQDKVKQRDYISFSDLGGSFLDRYYKMTGTAPSNPFNARTLGLFSAGKSVENSFIKDLLKTGMINKYQPEVMIPATDKTLKLFGYADCTIGGFKNKEEHIQALIKVFNQINTPLEKEEIGDEREYCEKAVAYYNDRFPEGLPETLIEVKSVSSKSFWQYGKIKNGVYQAYEHHKLQTYGYQKGLGLERAIIVYISRDDNVKSEYVLVENEELKQAFQKDIETMSAIFKGNQALPEPELFTKEYGKWSINWKLSYSSYLTKITGCSDKKELTAKYAEELKALNNIQK